LDEWYEIDFGKIRGWCSDASRHWWNKPLNPAVCAVGSMPKKARLQAFKASLWEKNGSVSFLFSFGRDSFLSASSTRKARERENGLGRTSMVLSLLVANEGINWGSQWAGSASQSLSMYRHGGATESLL
jgi:hypothetical protein